MQCQHDTEVIPASVEDVASSGQDGGKQEYLVCQQLGMEDQGSFVLPSDCTSVLVIPGRVHVLLVEPRQELGQLNW